MGSIRDGSRKVSSSMALDVGHVALSKLEFQEILSVQDLMFFDCKMLIHMGLVLLVF
jgi:hypothetical protein